MNIGDAMLSQSALHAEAWHGEPIKILTGLDAGQTFIAVKETEQDAILSEGLTGEKDPRAKRVIRFRDGNVPRLNLNAVVMTSDGRKWFATKKTDSGYLTTDFDLTEKLVTDQ